MASLTHSDLLTRIANRLRIPTSNTTETAKLTALMNDAYRAIATAHPTWWWLIDRQIVNTTAPVDDGTIAATAGSTTITFSSAPTSSVAGRKIVITENTDDPVAYRIASHTANVTTATLDAAYTGTDVTTSDFVVHHDEYDLAADTNRVVRVKRPGAQRPLDEVDPDQMDTLRATERTGPPEAWAIFNFDTSGDPTTQKQLCLWPYPDDTYRLEVDYVQSLNTEVSSTTRFLIPDDYVDVLLHATLADGYPIFLNDVQRGLYHQKKADAILGRMIATQRSYDPAPTIQPRDMYRGFYSSARRITPANADLGQYFDRWPGNR